MARKKATKENRVETGSGEYEPVHIRWLVRKDLPDVERISRESYDESCWTREDFERALQLRNVIGTVITVCDEVAGYVVYRLGNRSITVMNMAISPGSRRLGLGRRLVERLIGKLGPGQRQKLEVTVSEYADEACLFLRAMGLVAVKIVRDVWEDRNDVAYLFRYRVDWKETEN